MPMPTFCRVQGLVGQLTETSEKNAERAGLRLARGSLLTPLPPSKEGVVRILE